MICRIPRTEGRSRRRQAGLRSRKKGSLLDETNCIPCRPTVPRQKLGAKLPTAPASPPPPPRLSVKKQFNLRSRVFLWKLRGLEKVRRGLGCRCTAVRI